MKIDFEECGAFQYLQVERTEFPTQIDHSASENPIPKASSMTDLCVITSSKLSWVHFVPYISSKVRFEIMSVLIYFQLLRKLHILNSILCAVN